jgi:hypothetical protein
MQLVIPAKLQIQKVISAPLLIFIAISICLLVYWPGLKGSFTFDDMDNLKVLNNFGGVTDYNSFLNFVFGNKSGTLGRPVSMASFLINDQHWPGDPWFYKYTNLLIHTLIGLLLFLFVSVLLKSIKHSETTSFTIALFVSAIWLVHPLNVSTTLYVVQRMTQLMMLFSLLALLCYLPGRQYMDSNRNKSLALMSLGLLFFGALAVLSKENGVLVLAYVVVMEFTLFANSPIPRWYKIWRRYFLYTPLILLTIYFVATWPEVLSGYEHREFTLFERLLTESRILCEYLYLIIVPQIGGSGLIHDDIALSTSLFSPITTLLSMVSIFSLIFIAIKFRAKHKILSFSILWFFAGHILESSFIGLELYFEHRNYMPMVGPLVGLSYYTYVYAGKLGKRWLQNLPILVFIYCCVLTYQSSTTWSNPFLLYKVWAVEHPDSLRAQRVYAQSLMIVGEYDTALTVLNTTFNKHPYDISLPLAMANAACTNNQLPPYTPQEIVSFASNAKYTGGLLAIVKNFIDLNIGQSCVGISRQDVHTVLTALETVHGFRGAALAEMLLMHSDLYVLDHQLSPAVEILDKALKHQFVTVIPTRQAKLLASAGLYDEALVYLALAKKVESEQSILLPSQMHYLVEFETEILARRKGAL